MVEDKRRSNNSRLDIASRSLTMWIGKDRRKNKFSLTIRNFAFSDRKNVGKFHFTVGIAPNSYDYGSFFVVKSLPIPLYPIVAEFCLRQSNLVSPYGF